MSTLGTDLGEHDLYLLNEGTHRHLGEVLGARLHDSGGATFSLWAPNASKVSVVGDFNDWDPTVDELNVIGSSGVWSGTVGSARAGQVYKFAVTSQHGATVLKADPVAMFAEQAPSTGSIIWDLTYEWGDEAWMSQRSQATSVEAPISIYELHVGSWWRDPGAPEQVATYEMIADRLIDYVRRAGYTHVELLPVMEHPYYPSWGYQTSGYFAPSSRYGTPQELMRLIDRLHQAGIGVILDWVPSHFVGDEAALATLDGTHLYEHEDPRLGVHPDWKSLLFNYGRHEVRSFLVSSAMHWIDRYHADGIRVDAVASMLYLDYSRPEGEWIPNPAGGRENLDAIAFLRQLTDAVVDEAPDVALFAEESTGWPGVTRPTTDGGLGFRFTWDLGWMHDTLGYLGREPIHRSWHHHEMTFRSVYACNEHYVLPLSHDEVVHLKGSIVNKMPGDRWQQLATTRLLFAWQATQPGKKLQFMGDELGVLGEWNHDQGLDFGRLDDPAHAGILRLVADLNHLYRSADSLHGPDNDPTSFEWLLADETSTSIYAFLRRSKGGGVMVCAFNATPQFCADVALEVPVGGRWLEVLNTDAIDYGGSGVGNLGAVTAVDHGRHHHGLSVTLPPLGAVLLAPDTTGAQE